MTVPVARLHVFFSLGRVMMLEVWNPIEEVMNYYRNVSDFPFNFRFLTTMNANSNGRDAENAIRGWVDNIPDNGWPNWVVGVQNLLNYFHRSAARVLLCRVADGGAPLINSGA